MRRILPFMKHSIIRRIIVIFCLILTIALLSSGAFAYFYSRYAMERQILEDKRQSLNHTARQLDYLVNDIKNMALTVYVDQSMQDYLLSEDYDTYYDNYINSRDVRIKSVYLV
ncbi:MAG: hypothetical protein GX028_06770 [Clostridiaceae bacterium]|nr:hypothetical protein [Clostridiaceae bacterium]